MSEREHAGASHPPWPLERGAGEADATLLLVAGSGDCAIDISAAQPRVGRAVSLKRIRRAPAAPPRQGIKNAIPPAGNVGAKARRRACAPVVSASGQQGDARSPTPRRPARSLIEATVARRRVYFALSSPSSARTMKFFGAGGRADFRRRFPRARL
jgi:hypothetical protein